MSGLITPLKYVSIFHTYRYVPEWPLPIFSSGRMITNESLHMEDGGPCYTAKNTHDWLLQNGNKYIPWPSQSPNMKPMNHL